MSITETTAQNTLVLKFNELGIHSQFQDNATKVCKVLKAALQGGSKSKKDNKGLGKPDGAIFSDDKWTKPIALIEVKGSGDIEAAKEEVRGYILSASSKQLYIPLAIAFDGVSLCVDFFNEQSKSFSPCVLPNGTLFEKRFSDVGLYPTAEELIEVSRTSDGQLRLSTSVLDEKFTRDFIININNTMQVSSVPVIDRVVIFTAFLVACRSPLFLTTIKTVSQIDVDQIGIQVLAGFKQLVQQVKDEEVKKGLDSFYSFIEPKFTSSGDGSSNASKAIHAIALKDIPLLCSQHSKSVDDLINSLNESMFNIVDVYEAFQAYAPENDLGQYFTPRHIVRAMIRLIEQFRKRKLDETDIIYDPACGVGGFLVGALERVAESKHDPIERSALKRRFGERLLGCEPSSEIIQVARINLWMHGDGTSGIIKDSSLERDYLNDKTIKPGGHGMGKQTPSAHPVFKAYKGLTDKGYISPNPTVVLMNPPFPTKKKTYHAFEFVEHALSQLVEGGWLCAVVPATTIAVEDSMHVEFRKRVLKHAQLAGVIGMPADLFAPGASVNTYLLVLQKRNGGHKINETVLFARCPDDGYTMDKASQRRTAPKSPQEKLNKRWTNDGDFGGNLADLLAFNKVNSIDGDWWLKKHLEGGVDIKQFAFSTNLPKSVVENGSEWSPEKFILDEAIPERILLVANKIYGENLSFKLSQFMMGKISEPPQIGRIKIDEVNAVLKTLPRNCKISELLRVVSKKSVAGDEVVENGSIPLISTTEYNNGVNGFVNQSSEDFVVPAGTISVAKNGRPMVSRVQSEPYVKTADMAPLAIKEKEKYTERELSIIAALIELQGWRYSYGRKANWDRMSVQEIT